MLLFFVTGIATLSLLAPISSFAEPTHPNEIGLYLTNDGLGATGIDEFGTPLYVYLVLTKPTDTVTGTPYNTITAFECRLNFSPAGSLYLLGDVLPPESINIGDNTHFHDGYLEYAVEIYNDIPVIDESVQLIAFTFLQHVLGVIEVTLTPTSNFIPSIPGQMAFASESGQIRIMHSMGGSHDAPVFIFGGGEAVSVEQGSFGSVKALYR